MHYMLGSPENQNQLDICDKELAHETMEATKSKLWSVGQALCLGIPSCLGK